MARELTKERKYLALVAVCCALLSLTGCNREEENIASGMPVAFSTHVASTRSLRGEMDNNKLTSMTVFASATGTADFTTSSTAGLNYMYSQEMTRPAGGNWTYSPLKYWPLNEDEKVSFFAYAPSNKDINENNTGTGEALRTVITNPEINASGFPAFTFQTYFTQTDLLVSDPMLNCTNRTPAVNFKMRHALTKISFYVQSADVATQRTLTLLNLTTRNKGTFQWTPTGIKYENVGSTTREVLNNFSITLPSNTTEQKFIYSAFVLPDMTGATFKLTYTENSKADGTGSETITRKTAWLPFPADVTWAPGVAAAYVLKIGVKGIESITPIEQANWDEQPVPIPDGYDVAISSAEDLATFRDRVNAGELNLKAIQLCDIDLADLSTSATHSADATNWTPIGNISRNFTGIYNGNGHLIKGLSITSGATSTTEGFGLFGIVGNGALLTGINVRDAVIDAGSEVYGVGTLAGCNSGNISLCSATGKIPKLYITLSDGLDMNPIGGFVGSQKAEGTITQCSADVVIGGGEEWQEIGSKADMDIICAGGFIGINQGNIAACYSMSNITITPGRNTLDRFMSMSGGFVGGNDGGYIFGCHCEGQLTLGPLHPEEENRIDATPTLGGFSGYNFKSAGIVSCYTLVDIQPTANRYYVGGFVGYTISNSFVSLCYSAGSIPADVDVSQAAGGFCAKCQLSKVTNCHTTLPTATSAHTKNASTDITVSSTLPVMDLMRLRPKVYSRKYDYSTGTFTDYFFPFTQYDYTTGFYGITPVSRQWTSDGWSSVAGSNGYPEIDYGFSY